MTAPLLINNLTAGYVTGLPILHGVSVTVPDRKVVVIIGPNGAGKSTLIKAIAGLVPVSAGQVQLQGQNITGLRPDLLGAHGLAYVPQTDNIFRTLSIRQNLQLVLRGVPRATAAARLDELLVLFPALAENHRATAGALSGGQRQMLAVAMALARKPRVMLMDEPSAGLSPKVTEEVLRLARGLTDQGVSVLLVEQNVKQALKIADHCYILAEGRNQIDGPAAQLARDPVVGEIYLGGKRMGAA